MDIYIKPKEKIQIVGNRVVRLRDIAEVFINGESTATLENLIVFEVPKEKDRTYLLSVIDVIRAIHSTYPNATVSNVGEMDILMEYHEKPRNEKKVWEICKVAFVAIILFAGASTTIMCFHSDTQVPLIFENFYYLFFGENKEVPALLSIPYSIGLVAGIMVFFNHFSKISITDDPTPIEIEMTTYEKETNASVIDYLNRQKEKGGKKL